jgi:hypothetical protein
MIKLFDKMFRKQLILFVIIIASSFALIVVVASSQYSDKEIPKEPALTVVGV